MALRDYTLQNFMVWLVGGTLAFGAAGAAAVGIYHGATPDPLLAAAEETEDAEPAAAPDLALPALRAPTPASASLAQAPDAPMPVVPAIRNEMTTPHRVAAALPKLRPALPAHVRVAAARVVRPIPPKPPVVVAEVYPAEPPPPPTWRVRYAAPLPYYVYAPEYRLGRGPYRYYRGY